MCGFAALKVSQPDGRVSDHWAVPLSLAEGSFMYACTANMTGAVAHRQSSLSYNYLIIFFLAHRLPCWFQISGLAYGRVCSRAAISQCFLFTYNFNLTIHTDIKEVFDIKSDYRPDIQLFIIKHITYHIINQT